MWQGNESKLIDDILATRRVRTMLRSGPREVRVNGVTELYTQDVLFRNAIEEVMKDLVYQKLFDSKIHDLVNKHADMFNNTDDEHVKRQVFKEILQHVNRRILLDVNPLQVIRDAFA